MGKFLPIVIRRFFYAGKPKIGFLACLLLTISNSYSVNYNPKPVALILFENGIKPDSVLNDRISLANAHEIGYQAVSVLQMFESVLNSVSFNDNTDSELAGYIANSYTPGQRGRVFYSKATIIEDDINPKFDLGKNRDITADKYLNDLDLGYEKTPDFSIKFSNFVASTIKKKNYIFINIKFDESFGSKYKAEGSTYPLRHRIAEIRAERKGKKKWEALIAGIRYYDPAQPIDDISNSVPVVNSDSVANATVFKPAEVSNAMVEMVNEKMADTKKEKEQFASYIASGDALVKNKQYRNALNFYIKAEVLEPLSPVLYKKIVKVKRAIWHKRKNKKAKT